VAQDVLALLRDYQITNIDIDHREHFYTREASPQLLQPVNDLDPLVDVVSPLIPVLGLIWSLSEYVQFHRTYSSIHFLFMSAGGCRQITLARNMGSGAPILLRSAKVQPSNRPHPVLDIIIASIPGLTSHKFPL
jgi:hypothetical protein